MDDWNIHYLKKKIDTEDITDAEYSHKKKVCRDFKKNYGNIMTCMFKAIHC